MQRDSASRRGLGGGMQGPFFAGLLMVLAAPLAAQETDIARLLAENAGLRAQLAALQSDGSQCAPKPDAQNPDTQNPDSQNDEIARLLRKLSQQSDRLALGVIAPPDRPLVIPDSLLSAYVPGQYILTLGDGQPDLPQNTAEVAQMFALREDQLRYIYTRVFKGFAATLSLAERDRLAADRRIAAVAQDGYVFPAQGIGYASDEASHPNRKEVAPPPDDTPSSALTVYVFDSGIRAQHTALAGRIAPGFTSFRNGIGADDCNGHGTHVAASIGGRAFGQTDAARLVSVKVIDRDNWGDVSTLIAGVEWVIADPQRPAIANMSLTRAEPDPSETALLDKAVRALIAAGIPVFAAAGNQATDAAYFSPARIPEVITIGAMQGDVILPESNSGAGVDFYTNGSTILSASLRDVCGAETKSGTSMATARVTGFAAALIAGGKDISQLEAALRDRATEVDLTGFGAETHRYILSLPDEAPLLPSCPTGVIFEHNPQLPE